MDKQMFFDILDSELELATGCTEPGAIALASAYAGNALAKLGDKLVSMDVTCSTNIIKNAMGAGIPGTNYAGIPYAAAIGALRAQPERQLEVINGVAKEIYAAAEDLVRREAIHVALSDDPRKLYIEAVCIGSSHRTRAVIADLHTNLVELEADGKALPIESNEKSGSGKTTVPVEEIANFLTVRKIYDFIDQELDPLNDPIDIIRQAVEINSFVSARGLEQNYGLSIGRGLQEDIKRGLLQDDMVTNAQIAAAAAADARMAGAPYSVVANTGSGNQGITATMPVVSAASWLKVPEERMLRAVTLSHLVAIRIKSKFGRLSALCGASVAGTGAACGIAYLLNGDYDAICATIQNMIGDVAGLLCDGAKADCALKVSTCVYAAFQAAFMATRNVRVQKTDGIVEDNVEYTLDNFAVLGNEGSGPMDQSMLQMMMHKHA